MLDLYVSTMILLALSFILLKLASCDAELNLLSMDCVSLTYDPAAPADSRTPLLILVGLMNSQLELRGLSISLLIWIYWSTSLYLR